MDFCGSVKMSSKILLWILIGLLCLDILTCEEMEKFERKPKKSKKGKKSSTKKSCKCGRRPLRWLFTRGRSSSSSHLRVIEGTPVEPTYKYPWMVALYEGNKHWCGGALVSPYYVLTAAHCLLKIKYLTPPGYGKCIQLPDKKQYCISPIKNLSARYVGKWTGLSRKASIERISVHRKFSLPEHSNDIALLKLKKRISCTRFTSPICLPTGKMSKLYKPGVSLTIAGWGESKVGNTGELSWKPILREADLKIKKQKSCEITASNMHFCAKGKNQNACYGDSGGPIFKEVKGISYVMGLSSFGSSKDCDYSSSEYYLKITRYGSWILRNMKSSSYNRKKKGKTYISKDTITFSI